MGPNPLDVITDDYVRADLKEIRNSGVRLTNWEAQFIENVCLRKGLAMSDKQIETAKNIIRKYTG